MLIVGHMWHYAQVQSQHGYNMWRYSAFHIKLKFVAGGFEGMMSG